MYGCNNCDVYRCKKDLDFIPARELQLSCSSHLAPERYKVPMLLHLMSDSRKVMDTKEVLESAKLMIIEIERYPYFLLKTRRK